MRADKEASFDRTEKLAVRFFRKLTSPLFASSSSPPSARQYRLASSAKMWPAQIGYARAFDTKPKRGSIRQNGCRFARRRVMSSGIVNLCYSGELG